MNDITEIVDLPDPTVQPLVHPLDLPQARPDFRRSWLVGALSSPAVGLCAAAVIWFAGHSYLAPVIAGVAIIVIGVFVTPCFAHRAWDFIPRRRQDRQRPLPVSWDLLSALVSAVALFVTMLLVANRLDQSDVAVPVRDATLGIAAALAFLMMIEFAGRLASARRQALLSLPGIAAVLGIVVITYRNASGLSAATWWGVGGTLVFGVVAAAWKIASSGSR